MKKYLGAKVLILAVLMILAVSTLCFTGIQKPSGNTTKSQSNITTALTTAAESPMTTTVEPVVTETPVTE